MDANLPMRPHRYSEHPAHPQAIDRGILAALEVNPFHSCRSLGECLGIVLRHLTRFGDEPADVENGFVHVSRLFEGKASHAL
jgi:hypothetical protein